MVPSLPSLRPTRADGGASSPPAAAGPRPTADGYRPDIDGLRAVAVLAVLIYHAFPAAMPGGLVGVDIFFIISGFLISNIILGGLDKGRFSLGVFYARRVLRIFPALLVVLTACAAFAWFALFADEMKMLGKHIFAGAAFVSNLFLWNEVGYFDKAAETKPLLHLWSLGIEEQFYIVYPLLLAAAYRLRLKLGWVLAVLAAVSFVVNVGFLERYPSATFYSPASRAWELLLGGLLALWALGRSKNATAPSAEEGGEARGWRRWSATARSWVGLGLIAAALVLVRAEDGFPGWWALLPTVGAVLLISAGPRAWVNRVVLSNPVMVWFGLISYPLYLWHWPLLSFAQIIESQQPSAEIRGAAAVAAIILAWLTYRLVERPFRGHGTNLRKVALLATLMALVAAGGGWIYYGEGLPQRASVVENAKMQQALLLVEDVENVAACKERYGFTTIYEYCAIDRVDEEPTVVLLGDSHAGHILAGLTKYYASQGENLLYLSTRVPYLGLDPRDDPYQQATPKMLEMALAIDTIHTAIFATAVRIDNPDRIMLNALVETLWRFTRAGKQVVFYNDVPELGFDPRSCIRRAAIASSQTRRDCSISRSEFDKKTFAHYQLVDRVMKRFPRVHLFSPMPYFCDAERCHGIIDGKLMYRDKDHLSYEGDLYIGEKFAAEQAARRAAALPESAAAGRAQEKTPSPP